MIENISIGIGKSQSIGRGWEISAESCFPLAVLALHTRETDLVVLDLASTTNTVFFCKFAGFHLVHEQIEVVSDQFPISCLNDRFGWSLDTDLGRHLLFWLPQVSGCSREANAVWSVDHTQSACRVFPVLAASSSSRLGRFHQFHDALSHPVWNITADQAVPALLWKQMEEERVR